uniref:CBY1 interacting BAR domain containing 1 n=1 Tax=Erpetoichthys calabaricus TaxID=27687 RepID=A0A8C4TEC6_ERPCA
MSQMSFSGGDNQTKQIQEMVTNVKKHFGQLCQLFAAYTRKTARLRDKADLLVKEVHFYGDTETPNLRKGLKLFADQLAKVQDYRHAQVERLEAKVVEPLKSYGTILRFNRENLKATLSARSREVQQLQQLERMRQKNPSDRQIIVSLAESNLQRATMNATRTTLQLEEAIDEFEKKKIKDIKTIFTEFITIEMAFHAKALEVYTTAFHHIQDVEEDEDLQVSIGLILGLLLLLASCVFCLSSFASIISKPVQQLSFYHFASLPLTL